MNETIQIMISQNSSCTNNFLLWGVTVLLFPLIALVYSQKAPSKAFWTIWGFVAVISGLILAFIVMNPLWASDILVKIQGVIK